MASAGGLVVGVLAAGPAVASASAAAHLDGHGPHGAPGAGLSLAQAPSALRAAVRRALGVHAAPAARTFQQAELDDPGATAGDDFALSVAISGSTAVVGADGDTSGTGAAYVFTRSGTHWAEQTELTASDGAQGDYFGTSVAISGSTVVVGADGENYQAGAVYVFTRSGTAWSQQAELTASDAAEDNFFGYSVALSNSNLVVGSNGNNTFTGAAYMFTRSGTAWSQQAEVTPADGVTFGYFGNTVAISGSTAVVSANSSTPGTGAAYVYARSGTAWSQQAELTDPGAAQSDYFASSVGISGSTLVVGAPGVHADTGVAYVYTRSGRIWSQPAQLTAAGGVYLGYSVAISGSTAVAGALGNNSLAGAAYVFTRSGTTWSQQAMVAAADGASGDYLGFSVAISGSYVIAGAPQRNSNAGAAYAFALPSQQAELAAGDGGPGDSLGSSVAISGSTAVVGAGSDKFHPGAAYVFTRTGTAWTEQAELTASDGAPGDGFGDSVAISGPAVVIGAAGHGSHAGAAYVFARSGTAWSQQAELTASDGVAGDEFGSSVAISGSTAIAGAPGHGSYAGAAYVFTQSGTVWSQQAELTASDGASGDGLGSSVAISGATVVAGAPGHGSYAGAAYVFTQSGTAWTQQAELTASDGASGDGLGSSVAISGSTAVAGAPGHGSYAGAAYVFTQSGTTWTQRAELAASDGASGDDFGTSVAISGSTAVAGAYRNASLTGAAYVFTRSGTAWSQQAELTGADSAPGDYFGVCVAISGLTALAGAQGTDSGTGTAYVFTKV
jgi:hypothetical protein